METRMRPNALIAIWLGGAMLAAVAYVVGPDRLLYQAWDVLAGLQAGLAAFADTLAAASFDLLRALAIGLFIVFVLLALVAIRRGLRGRTALVVVSSIYLSSSAPARPGAPGPWPFC